MLLHLPAATWQGREGSGWGTRNLSVQDMEGWGAGAKSLSLAVRKENANSKQINKSSN